MSRVDQKRTYGNYSRLRWQEIVYDYDEKAVRLGDKDWGIVARLKYGVGYKTWKIPPQYANRPDLIANFFYGTPGLWWVISAYNNFFHPLKDMYVDRVIMIPDANGVSALLT
jgi:hypothetical protein